MVPGVTDGGLGHHPVVQALLRSEIIPQILHGLDVVLLLRGEDGIKGLELNRDGAGRRKDKQLGTPCGPKPVAWWCQRQGVTKPSPNKACSTWNHCPSAHLPEVSVLPTNQEDSSFEGVKNSSSVRLGQESSLSAACPIPVPHSGKIFSLMRNTERW